MRFLAVISLEIYNLQLQMMNSGIFNCKLKIVNYPKQ